MPNESADAGTMAATACLCVGRPRAAGPDRLELRLLFVIELSVEVVQGCTHKLDRLQHGVEPVCDRLKPCRRRNRFCGRARGLERVRRLCGCVLQRHKTGTLLFIWTKPRVHLGGWPVGYAGLCGSAGLSERGICVSVSVSRGVTPALILDKPVQPGSLFVVEQIVKLLQC